MSAPASTGWFRLEGDHLLPELHVQPGAARRDVTIEAGLSSRTKRVSVRGAKRGPEVLLPRA